MSFFRFALLYPALYIFVFFALFSSTKVWIILVIFPLHFFAMFCLFYDLYFVAKNLVLAETGRVKSFYDFAGPFFLLWFFPVGVWIVQPRINRLYLRGASPLPTSEPAGLSDASTPGPSAEETVYAGFWLRSAATLIDALALCFPFLFVTIISFRVLEAVLEAKRYDADLSLLAWPIISIVVTLFYFPLLESSRRQATLGKMAVGLRVSDIEGQRLTLGRAAGRTLAKYLSCLTLGVGFIMCGFTSKKQALHDIIASCLVLRRRQ